MPNTYNIDKETVRNKPSINYLGKDFISIKQDLIQHAKSYFPNTYQDFNETSPGMMMVELSAYLGDVLSFYIYPQFKEMFLTTAVHTEGDLNGLEYLYDEAKSGNHNFIFVNLVDLDMLYGHREDPHGYYEGLKLIDKKIQVKFQFCLVQFISLIL